MESTVRLALVRHPTPDVPYGTCYGRLDVPVGPRAADEGREIARQLAGFRRAMLWTSPAIRCQYLADLLSEMLDAGPARVEPRLRELDFGAWEGRAWNDIDRAELDLWSADPAAFSAPGGEAGHELVARVRSFYGELSESDGTHIVVSHGGPLKLLSAIARNELPDLLATAPPYASVTTLPLPRRK